MTIEEILRKAIEIDAADIFLVAGLPVTFKCGGRQERMQGDFLRPDDITLLAITEALDGPVSILTCLSRPKTCNRHLSCPARSIWGDLNLTIRDTLASITLSSVMKRLGLRHDDVDYCI